MSESKNPQIFITKLSRNTTTEQIRRVFKDFGEIKSINLKSTYGFVVSIVSIYKLTYIEFITYVHVQHAIYISHVAIHICILYSVYGFEQ